jgi:hypothetical protein
METVNQDDVNYTDVVSGLLQETNDWINIQDIIKLTFKSVFDVIKSQSELIKEIEAQLPSKTTKSELVASLQLKHDYADFTKYASEINNKKADKEDIDKHIALLKNDYNDKLNSSTLSLKDHIQSSIENAMRPINSEIASIKESIEKCLKADAYEEKIKELEQRLDNLTEQIEAKPNTTEITTALHKKANKADVDALLLTKAEKSDIDGSVQQLSTKIGEINDDIKQLDSNINHIKESYQTKLNEIEATFSSSCTVLREELNGIHSSLTEQMKSKLESFEFKKSALDFKSKLEKVSVELTGSINSMYTQINEVKDKVTKESQSFTDKISNKLENKLNEEVHKLAAQLQTHSVLQEETKKFKSVMSNNSDILGKRITDLEKLLKESLSIHDGQIDSKCDKRDLNELKQKILNKIEPKVDLTEVQSIVGSEHIQLMAEIGQHKSDIESSIKLQEEHFLTLLDKKLSAHEVAGMISQKVDQTTFASALKTKIDCSEHEKIKTAIDQIKSHTKSKEIDEQSQILLQLEDLNKELLLKANIKDVCTLLDMKANIDDINKALLDIHKSLEGTAKSEDMTKTLNEQALINEALCSENCVGRWIWKSGELKSGYAIPWEVQSVNTCPENYVWESGKSIIIIMAPGLYELMLGFYASKKPTIQLLVNGESVLSSANNNAK